MTRSTWVWTIKWAAVACVGRRLLRRSICHLCTSFGSVFVFGSVFGLFLLLFLCFVRVLFVVFVCVFSGYVDMIWHGATRDAATRRTFLAGRSTSVTLLRATRMMGSSRKSGSGGSGGRAPRGLTVGGTPCPRSTHSLLRVGPDPRPTHFERCSLSLLIGLALGSTTPYPWRAAQA